MRFFTSDHHFGHANIIGYCDRNFPHVDAMNKAMFDNWNALVGPNDEVWVLGDLAMPGTFNDVAPVWLAHLNGTKHLLVGNHDNSFQATKRHYDRRYIEEIGFASVSHGSMDFTLNNGQDVLMCHFPYRGDPRDKYFSYRPEDNGLWLLHGHIHNRWAVKRNERMINVGVDAWDFAPLSEDEVISIIDGSPSSPKSSLGRY